MELIRTARFRRAYRKLESRHREQVKKAGISHILWGWVASPIVLGALTGNGQYDWPPTQNKWEIPKKALAQLLADRTHPGLRVKRVRGTENVWELRAGRDIRVTFEIEADAYVLRNVGHHDRTLRRP